MQCARLHAVRRGKTKQASPPPCCAIPAVPAPPAVPAVPAWADIYLPHRGGGAQMPAPKQHQGEGVEAGGRVGGRGVTHPSIWAQGQERRGFPGGDGAQNRCSTLGGQGQGPSQQLKLNRCQAPSTGTEGTARRACLFTQACKSADAFNASARSSAVAVHAHPSRRAPGVAPRAGRALRWHGNSAPAAQTSASSATGEPPALWLKAVLDIHACRATGLQVKCCLQRQCWELGGGCAQTPP